MQASICSRQMKRIHSAHVLLFLVLAHCLIASAAATTNLTTLFAFDGTNGKVPEDALIQGSDGCIYGTAMEGGVYTNWGTIFKITPDGTFAVLHSFDYTNGGSPQAGLT